MGGWLSKMFAAFYAKEMEVVLVGLENSGKTTLLNVMANGQAVETCPTIGLNVKKLKRGGVNMKCWDIGGQRQYRSEWARYTKGCDCILFVVDAYAREHIPTARKELHRLLENRDLASTPIMVCANKIDLEPHISEMELIRELNLDYVFDNAWIVCPISALHKTNIDQVLEWLIKQAK